MTQLLPGITITTRLNASAVAGGNIRSSLIQPVPRSPILISVSLLGNISDPNCHMNGSISGAALPYGKFVACHQRSEPAPVNLPTLRHEFHRDPNCGGAAR